MYYHNVRNYHFSWNWLGLCLFFFAGTSPGKNKEYCEKAGGQWTAYGTCLLSYKKAGDTCTDGGQCISGACRPPTLTDEQKINLTKGSLKDIIGTCYPEDQVTGCVEQVIMGTISKESMCLDNE